MHKETKMVQVCRPSIWADDCTFSFLSYSKRGDKQMEERRITCTGYFDDWIFAARTEEEALMLREKIRKEMEELGWVRAIEKGQWNPSQEVEYLGFLINTKEGAGKYQS